MGRLAGDPGEPVLQLSSTAGGLQTQEARGEGEGRRLSAEFPVRGDAGICSLRPSVHWMRTTHTMEGSLLKVTD